MIPIHPLTVHLPIGLLIGNALLTILYLRRSDPEDHGLEVAAYHCLWLGFVLLLPTIAAGTYDAVQYLAIPSGPPKQIGWLNAHALSGAAIAVVYWQAWQMRRKSPDLLATPARRGYLARLAIGSALLVLSGWIGGHMVYELGIGIGP